MSGKHKKSKLHTPKPKGTLRNYLKNQNRASGSSTPDSHYLGSPEKFSQGPHADTSTVVHEARNLNSNIMEQENPALQIGSSPGASHQEIPLGVTPADLRELRISIGEDIRNLMKGMLTRQDLEHHTTRLESALRGEMEDIRQDLTHTMGRLDAVEGTVAEVRQEMSSMAVNHSRVVSQLTSQMRTQQLISDDHENRSRRNNVKIRGIPESVKSTELKSKVLHIINSYLEVPLDSTVEIDRVHRTLGPQDPLLRKPRDVLCRLHYYSVKETLMRKAWERGEIDFEDTRISILPDLSRKTLYMRACLKPLLATIREKGGSYKWGHPFHLNIRLGEDSFRLQFHSQLRDVYRFLGSDPLVIRDWLAPAPVTPSLPRGRGGRERREPPQ